MDSVLDFEKPLQDLERRIAALQGQLDEGKGHPKELEHLRSQLQSALHEVFIGLTPWQRVQLARHPRRPHSIDYLDFLLEDFLELHGDRTSGEDPAVLAGLGKFSGKPIVFAGHEKGRNTAEKLHRNFGMPTPAGFRKVLRVARLAERLGRPLLLMVDTPGAFPGIEAEERGQIQAIAENILQLLSLRTPVVVVLIGEGGSGGALALGIGDVVLMQEHAIYSVISPEGCASILWRNADHVQEAAAQLRLTSAEVLGQRVVDAIVPEPPGGAHRDPAEAGRLLGRELEAAFARLESTSRDELVARRLDRFRHLGLPPALPGRTTP